MERHFTAEERSRGRIGAIDYLGDRGCAQRLRTRLEPRGEREEAAEGLAEA